MVASVAASLERSELVNKESARGAHGRYQNRKLHPNNRGKPPEPMGKAKQCDSPLCVLLIQAVLNKVNALVLK